jgi:hypothetical protein
MDRTANPDSDGHVKNSIEWCKYVVVGPIVVFALYKAISYLLTPRPSFVSHVDPGDSKLVVDNRFLINVELDLEPNLAISEITFDAPGKSLIMRERRSND